MKKSTFVKFQAPIEKVWDVVTDNTNYAWRSDISKIIISNDDKCFSEFTKDGIETKFNITLKEPFVRYEFDLENDNMSGHWVGVFSEDNNMTQIEITEEIKVKKLILNLVVGLYLKKQQSTYIADLKRAISK